MFGQRVGSKFSSIFLFLPPTFKIIVVAEMPCFPFLVSPPYSFSFCWLASPAEINLSYEIEWRGSGFYYTIFVSSLLQ